MTPTDPTAGRRARRIVAHPGVPEPVVDPTDPRYGRLPLENAELERAADPTEPRRRTSADPTETPGPRLAEPTRGRRAG